MATVLGKRKKSSGTKEPTGEDAIQDIFRRHFEAQFKPLAPVAKKADKKTKKAKTTEITSSNSGKKLKNSSTVVINENESDEESDDDGDEDNGSEDSKDDESETWSGLHEDEDDEDDEVEDDTPAIEVVDYSTDPTKEAPEATMTKHERKLYLSKRPPTSFDEDATRAANSKKNKKKEEGEKQYKDAPDLLANDLELQRLISESHLLAGAFALPSTFSTSSGAASTFGAAGGAGTANLANHKSSQPFAAGRLRQKATDLRIQAVANKAKGDAVGGGTVTVSQTSESIFTQAKMPMAMRKGIAAAAASREKKRRQEAKEAGIVLERPVLKPSKSAAKRMRAVDAPAVGRLRGSELKLRDRDVREIEGPKKSMGKKKKKRR
ncbi:pre-rRNA processing and 40S ribosomal subunit assembly [Sporothrix stenoceras]|uniref:Pre-rRNA processing and 40S ribosomal subunit assembly n=1 Tax=Sporothrix stenoceras TaxID=5173 RepID=A0ABR3ZFM0_9PEZI